jgi:hypothetical protein
MMLSCLRAAVGTLTAKGFGSTGQAQAQYRAAFLAEGCTMSSDLFEISRSLRDVQSRVSRVDHHLSRLAGSDRDRRRGGDQLVRRAAAALAGVSGNFFLSTALEKAAVSPAMTGVSGWAQELSAVGLPGFILSLERQSALAAILAKSPQVSLLGKGQTKVPTAGLAPAARVVSEGAPIPVIKGSFAPLDLVPFKLAAIMHFSKELAEASIIENAVRVLLSQSISAGIDNVGFGTTLPGGLLNGITPITASAATPAAAAMIADLKALVAALTAPSPDIVFVMSPANAAVASALLPSSFAYSIVTSSAVPVSTVVAVDPAGVAAAMAEPRILASESAAVHEEDVAPLPLVSGTTQPPTLAQIATPMRASFQSDVALLRIIADLAWAARPGAVAVVNNVTW